MIDSKATLFAFWQQLDQPTHRYRLPKAGRMRFGQSGAPYPQDTTLIEGFLRLLWGAAPVSIATKHRNELAFYEQGILAGVDPKSPHYWGKMQDNDQLMVEVASLAVTLIITKDYFWATLAETDQQNIYRWLDQINHHEVPANNWRFFRVLVNAAFIKLGELADDTRLTEDFAMIESLYQGNGWYCDGVTTQRDYYIAWAFHFYGLVYAKLMGDVDPAHAALFKQRAARFAQDFRYWFDADSGAAVPFGRSLTYRFAEAAFWSALVYADVEALPWGQIKTLLFGNLNYWQQQTMTRSDGVLSLGYAYENQIMTEAYNASGSPYWAFKVFMLLAVPAEHPFWQAAAVPVTGRQAQFHSEQGRFLVTNHTGGNVQLYLADAGTQQVHSVDKYNKFVYSSRSGFSVQRSNTTYREGGFDNTLALALAGDDHYLTKEHDLAWSISDTAVYHHWQVLDWGTIDTWVIPLGQWHVRIHHIMATKALTAVDGGFSEGQYLDQAGHHKAQVTQDTLSTTIHGSQGTSSAVGLQGFDAAKVQYPEPSTSLLFQNSGYPKLTATVQLGDNWLVSAFYLGDEPTPVVPTVRLQAERYEVTLAEQVVTGDLTPAATKDA